ncbi:MAG: hypothetical protein Q4C01_06160, partial [Clostridia bacterium]|nr:hypothetical protein [Clostridia bacterium]
AFGREVRFAREVCGKAARFGTRMRNTLLHFALKAQNFTSSQAKLHVGVSRHFIKNEARLTAHEDASLMKK